MKIIRTTLHNGYTLLELITAIAVMGIVYSLSVPSLPALMRRSPLKSETRHLAENLNFLALSALQRMTEITVAVEPNRFSATAGKTQQKILVAYALPAPLRFGTGTASRIKFNERGTCTPHSITLTDGSAQCAVILSLRCRVRTVC